MESEKVVFCMVCGENLGKHKPRFAKNHLKKYPNHDSFIVMKIIDPLLFSNPDTWFKKHTPLMRRYLTERKNDKDLTESSTGCC